MTLAAWLGIGAGVLVLLGGIQTLRLRLAKRDLAAVMKSLKAAEAAARLHDARQDADDRALRLARKEQAEAQARLERVLTLLKTRKDEIDDELQDVEDAHGDDAATLDVLRDVLNAGESVPERGPEAGSGWEDDPV